MDATLSEGGQHHELAILAYGSLVADPGWEIEDITSHRIDGVLTPFPVEYARSSSGRKGAPTLVPVAEGGGPVCAAVLVIAAGVGLEEARHRLYRREIDQVGTGKLYMHTRAPRSGRVWLPTLDQFNGVRLTVYTHLADNIPLERRLPTHLADLAIKSVPLAKAGKDGNTYLECNLAYGIVTPLTPAYEAAILEQTNTDSLADARLAST